MTDVSDFERALLANMRYWKRHRAVDADTSMHTVLDVRLGGDFPDTRLEFIFHDKRRPECLLGYDWGNIWERESQGSYRHRWGESAESLAMVAGVNFDELEEDMELPEECVEGEIFWLDESWPAG